MQHSVIKQTIPFLCVFVFILSICIPIQDVSNTVKSTGDIIANGVAAIGRTTKQSIVTVTRTIAQKAGIEKVEMIYPDSIKTEFPVVISDPIRIITISPESPIASVLNCLSRTIAMTVNPFGIITIGEMSIEVQQEELYHWWDASRLGTVKYYYQYITEYITRVIKYRDTHIAYRYLSFEMRAKAYVGWVITLV